MSPISEEEMMKMSTTVCIGSGKFIVRYDMHKTRHYTSSESGSNLPINGYVDYDYVGDLDKNKSTTGYVFKVAGEAASPAKTLVPSVQITANGFVSRGMSLEESVLKELEMVMTQLSDKTRICFRDAFYGLAKNSKRNPIALDQHGNHRAQTHSPKWAISEDKIRSGKKETTEPETNTIDRMIANLAFNKIDINVRDFPVC
ncbi:putative orf protein [Hibiscus syriacus]|uniref:Orf protein n=1 Tax=Hibiscus syriacus TaxID=106335 RepID=A0A6A2WWV4_HIBSY|nr:putative orf protein [Hibiscus syriacus]